MSGYSSRWYFPFYEGLAEGQHVRAMGSAVWLYLWMLGRAWVAQKEGAFTYSHLDAARELDTNERTIRRWFNTLQKHGYIIKRARGRHDLDVAISKWRTVEEWLDSRGAGGGVSLGAVHSRTDKNVRSQETTTDKNVRSGADVPQDTGARTDKNVRSGSRTDIRTDIRTDKNVRSGPILSIRLQGYSYPTGPAASRQDVPDEAICLADLFHDLKAKLVTAKNRPAVLATIYRLCFGDAGKDQPSFGYLGKVAKQVGGAGRLAELMWQLTCKERKSDPLPYLVQWHKGEQARKKGRRERGDDLPDAEQFQRRADEQGGAIRRARIFDEES